MQEITRQEAQQVDGGNELLDLIIHILTGKGPWV
jgi:hypothetical protein